jgi:prophage regulatory protein
MIVLKSARDQILAALQSVSGIVERRHTQPILSNALAQCSITNGMPSGTVTEGECSESTGADGAPPAASGDDDDGGESDGEPARPRPRKTSRRAAAPLPREPQPLAALPRATAQPQVNLTAPPPTAALWRLPEVLRNVPVSRATLYAWIEQGRFPKPIKIGPRAVAWRSADVLALTV